MLGATTKLALYATYLLSTATVQSALARPSFFQTSGWELVDDEPTLRVETTKHEWGSNDVSITKSEYYETKDGEMELELHGSAEGGRDEADVQLEYELLENTWVAQVLSNGDSATGKIDHEKGITTAALSGNAMGADNTAIVELGSAIDECDPDEDVNCYAAVSLYIEGEDFEGEFLISQEYEADGLIASTIGKGNVETIPGNAQNDVTGAGLSAIQFDPTLEADISVDAEGSGVNTNTEASASITPVAG